MSRSSEYNTWIKMIERCENPKSRNFADYGSRGIRVCEEWRKSFAAFFRDMGQKPSPKHSIDRIDNDGNYEPNNCRWATRKEQTRNRRVTQTTILDGKKITLAELSEISKIPTNTLRGRITRGWPEDRLFDRRNHRFRVPR